MLVLPLVAATGISHANGHACVGGAPVLFEGAEQASADQVVVPIDPQGHQESIQLTEEQARNAATITNVARTRGLPPRAAVIAVATAIQESGLNNLDHGDRDSVGLFQQRPSQGWGTATQLTDPIHASDRFYDALLGVSDWETRPLTDVAQAVQRSAYPQEYAKWEETAGGLVSGAWGMHAVASVVECDSGGGMDPAADFTARNPRTPTEAIAAAWNAEGETGWYRQCDRFVAQTYGWANSGSATANDHWARLVDAGLAHPGDTSPPAGALLFYDTGQAAGHVALYLGDGLVASNDVLDDYRGEGEIAVVPRDELTDGHWRLRYRGWAEPAFPDASGTSTI
ncbi:hypothetical protein [Streptomyces sp. B6B3]|uniref:hypothetical protein n=1 Tax=Streptomyces sp. B6B3 TaxID=3153570 RepID=UPI00325F5768